MKWFYNMKISVKLILSFVLVALLAGIVGVFGTVNMKAIEESDTELFENMTLPMSYLNTITERFQRIRVESRDAIIYDDEKGIEESISLINQYRNDIDEAAAKLEKTILSEEYRNLYDEFLVTRENYGNTLEHFYEMVRENKDEEAFKDINGEMKVVADAERIAIENLVNLKEEHAGEKAENNRSTADSAISVMITFIVVAMILAIGLGIFVSRLISRPVNRTLHMIKELMKGHIDNRLNMDTNDEIGQMAKEMDNFADDLQNNLIDSMIKLSEGNTDIKIKSKDENDVISPAIQKTVDTINTLIDEMNNMSEQHDLGDIDIVVNEKKFKGAYKEMAVGINKMVSGHISVKKKAMACIDEFANGNFEAEIETFPGKKVFINEVIEKVRKNLKEVSGEVNILINASEEGNLSKRGDSSKFKGDWKLLVDGLNGLLDKVIEPVKEASVVLQEMSKGNLQVKVEGNYKGDHADIKNSLNFTIETIYSYINELSKVLREMSNGNLDLGIDKEYLGNFVEIKDSINLIINAFNEIMGEINESAEQVALGSGQLSQSSQTLSQGSTEQASSIQEITSSIEEIASQTSENDKNANQANDIAVTSKDDAVAGNKQMKEMLKAMGEINDASANISKIIKVIDEIAFQTNILALNAAVEAARAGQHGKGFAVVAEEVRNLAARSANAAKETTALIEGSIKKVDMGTKIANDTAEALDKIVVGVAKVADIVGGIAVASNEQASGIAQVNKAIEQVSQVTQTNSATAEESASSSEELSSQANLLKNTVSRFKIKSNINDIQSGLGYKKLNKDIIKMIDSNQSNNLAENSELAHSNDDSNKIKISLGGNQFGKY